jgi:class 3 adenylate cyclase
MAGAAVTMLFSDIEGSTLLLQRLGERFSELIAEHHRVLRLAIEAGGARVIRVEGDSFFAVFGRVLTRLIVRNERRGT